MSSLLLKITRKLLAKIDTSSGQVSLFAIEAEHATEAGRGIRRDSKTQGNTTSNTLTS